MNKPSDAVLALMAREEELVPASAIAPIVKMHPAVIIKYAKEGKWPREICNFIISGRNVKFYRTDFLRKGGWIPDEEPKKTNEDRLDELIELIRVNNGMMMEALAYIKQSARAATLTDLEKGDSVE